MNLKLEHSKNATTPTGHVASFRMPLKLNAMENMNAFIIAAYGKDCTVREEPEGWLKVETPNAEAHGRRSRTVQPLVGSLGSE